MRRVHDYWDNYRSPSPPPDPNKPLLAEVRELWSLAGLVTKRPTRFGPDTLPKFSGRAWAAYSLLALVVWVTLVGIFWHVLGYRITMAIVGLMAIVIAAVVFIESRRS